MITRPSVPEQQQAFKLGDDVYWTYDDDVSPGSMNPGEMAIDVFILFLIHNIFGENHMFDDFRSSSVNSHLHITQGAFVELWKGMSQQPTLGADLWFCVWAVVCEAVTAVSLSSALTSQPASGLLIGPVHLLQRRHGGDVVLWGCHSSLWKKKIEGADVALGHPHPSCFSSDRTHHIEDLPGRLTSQWDDQRRPFTSTISRLRSLYDKPPASLRTPSAATPRTPVRFSLFFLSTTPPCVSSGLILLWWFKMGWSCSNYKWQSYQKGTKQSKKGMAKMWPRDQSWSTESFMWPTITSIYQYTCVL